MLGPRATLRSRGRHRMSQNATLDEDVFSSTKLLERSSQGLENVRAGSRVRWVLPERPHCAIPDRRTGARYLIGARRRRRPYLRRATRAAPLGEPRALPERREAGYRLLRALPERPRGGPAGRVLPERLGVSSGELLFASEAVTAPPCGVKTAPLGQRLHWAKTAPRGRFK